MWILFKTSHKCYKKNAKSYFDEEGQSVLFESKKAEDMMLPTLGKGHQVSKAVNKYWLSLEHLNGDDNH